MGQRGAGAAGADKLRTSSFGQIIVRGWHRQLDEYACATGQWVGGWGHTTMRQVRGGCSMKQVAVALKDYCPAGYCQLLTSL